MRSDNFFALFFTVLLSCVAYIPGSHAQTNPKKYSWALLYYMPYDNNLTVYADTVERMIVSGISSTDVTAAIFRDDAKIDGTEIISIEKNRIKRVSTSLEKSNSVESLRFFLQWTIQNIRSDHYAFIFLDHGGEPTELCLDEEPDKGFLHIDNVRYELMNFNKSMGRSLDLIYLQVCAKGAIEPLFELKDCSTYTLSSENVLGAPNYYYQKTLTGISRETTALELAMNIAATERSDMFYSLTLVNNQRLDGLKRKLDELFKSLSTGKIEVDPSKIKQVFYMTTYWDLLSFLESIEISANQKLLRAECIRLLHELIVFHHVNKDDNRMMGFCGISMIAPLKKNYSPDNLKLLFFRDSALPRLVGNFSQKK